MFELRARHFRFLSTFLWLSLFWAADSDDLVGLSKEYAVRVIEPPQSSQLSSAYGINRWGQVVGVVYEMVNTEPVNRRAFVWSAAGGLILLPTLSGESSAWGINDHEFVSGYSTNEAAQQHAVRWNLRDQPISVLDLGTLTNTSSGLSGDSSTGYDINNLGQESGFSDIPNEAGDFMPFHALLFDDTSGLLDLGTLDTQNPQYQFGYSISYDVNDDQEIVGLATNSSWEYRPFIYDPVNLMRQLPRDPAYDSGEWYAVAINNSRLIGGHVIVGDNESLPYYWTSPAAQPIPLTMPAQFPYGEIYGLNESGTMVGVMWNNSGTEHGFVFDDTNGVRDLNDLIGESPGVEVQFARDINNAGEIVGRGRFNGVTRGFVLTSYMAWVLDGFGGLHPGGGAPAPSPPCPYFGFDIARDFVRAPDGFYVLDGFGGVHACGGTSPMTPGTPYFGFDIARDLELADTGFYVLDGFGGVHHGGGAPPMNPATPYFGFDVARDLELGTSGFYVLDGFGGTHAGGGAALVSPGSPYFGFDVARDLELAADGYYVLDGFGGVHSGGAVASLSGTPYFGFDIARDLEVTADGYYVLDGYGGIHAGGGASPIDPAPVYFGFDIAKDLELRR